MTLSLVVPLLSCSSCRAMMSGEPRRLTRAWARAVISAAVLHVSPSPSWVPTGDRLRTLKVATRMGPGLPVMVVDSLASVVAW